jgi:hypothetical protein
MLVNDYKLECVKEYKYLGLLIGCGGNFSTAISDLVNRGQKAFFKVKVFLNMVSPVFILY